MMNDIKNNSGAITVYVVIACLFIIIIGIGAYIMVSNKQAAQLEQLNELQGAYQGNLTQEELYNNYNGGEIIPVLSEEQMLKMGSGEEIYIDGKIYTMTPEKTYVLKENWEENAEFTNKVAIVENGNGVIIKEYKVETIANKPKISKGMIPVKFDITKTENGNNGEWVICSATDPEWYSYTEKDKKWANIMLCDGKYNENAPAGTVVKEEELGSMFVWIPRYAYKITSGYHSTSGSIEIVWLKGNSYNYIDSEGNICTAKNGNEENVTTNNASYYVTHPAFTNGNTYGIFDNGEWKEEITGIWVAKFQAGFATTENDIKQKVTIPSSSTSTTTPTEVYYPMFKGRKYAYNYVSVSQCYDLSQALDDSGNPYGLTTLSNSHLMKSSEWGAVTYLSISKYGYSGGSSNKEKAKNNLSIVKYSSNVSSSPVSNPNNNSWKITAITGYSAPEGKTAQNVMQYSSVTDLKDSISGSNGISYAWNNVLNGSDVGDGTKSSTTGNIYGIYDMGGCLADYTASYINATGENDLITYGGSFAKGTSTYLATAYPYQTDLNISYATDYKDFNSAYPGFVNVFGDAIWETSSGTGNYRAWFEQILEDDSTVSEVFFVRGGHWANTDFVGLCGVFDRTGNVIFHCGFHSVLVVE